MFVLMQLDVSKMLLYARLPNYAYLMRLDKPIGIFLLLWPTLWALWLASNGHPSPHTLFVFIAGVFLMRTAGCVLNDLADRRFDAHVARTQKRPIASGKVTPYEALLLALVLLASAFLLVLSCRKITIWFAFLGAGITVIYPFLKRFTHLPQLGLSVAFSWGIPMVFVEIKGYVDGTAWFLFAAACFWPLIYDTLYAMVDREDDMKIGVKSTAILFDNREILIVGLLQFCFLALFFFIGILFHLHAIFYVSLLAVFLLFVYQQYLIKDRDTKACFRAFLNNNWVGFAIFAGIFLSYLP